MARGSAYRRFNMALLALVVAGAAWMLGLGFWLEPVSGDLARLGFRAENEYGWRGQQAVFEPALARPGELDGQYDVVVAGDSFSRPVPGESWEGRYWTDHLAAKTGLSVGVFRHEATPLDAVLDSPAARAARLVVVEVVERQLRAVLDVPGPCAPPPAPMALGLPVARPPPPRMRRRQVAGLPAGPDYLFAFVRADLQRRLTGGDGTKVRQLRLDPPGPFTSRRPDRLLVYRADYYRRQWDGGTWEQIGCRAAAVQARVTRRGAGFLLLVVPDKTTAYASLLAPADRTIEAVPRLLRAMPGLAVVRVDLAVQAAIAAGVEDVYLPDDTHWGSAGAAIGAQAVIEAAGGRRLAQAD
jgi:hypothetical protein